jgi:CheY-specific phosphatase CheX
MDRQVLVVDSAEGAISGVMEELDLLGFRVIWVPTLVAALEFVKASPRVSLVVASAEAGRAGGTEFLAGVKELRPTLRIIWGVRPDGVPVRQRAASLDSLIPEPIQPDTLRKTVSMLLAEYFYPSSIADAVKSAALEILGPLGDFRIEGDSFLVPNQRSLADFSSIIGFSGEATGHLMLSTGAVDAKALHRRLLPGTHSVPIERLEDMVGELCNQILGRINAFFWRHSIAIQQTTPIFMRSAGSTMRYAGRHPSFGVQLVSGQASLALEYYLADFNKSKLLVGEADQVMGIGEIRYL